MNEIVSKEEIAPDTYRYIINHPKIARKRKAGQFVILRTHDGGERVPLTIVDSDPGIEDSGTVCVIRGGYGTAPVLPIAAALKEAGNDLIGIIGARTKEPECHPGAPAGTSSVRAARLRRSAWLQALGTVSSTYPYRANSCVGPL